MAGGGGLEKSDLDELINKNREVIRVLEQLKARIVDVHKNCSISKTIGASVSTAGSLATIGGICLAPFTFGLSLGLTAVGLVGTIGGAGTMLTTDIVEQVKTKEWAAELKNVLDSRADAFNRIGDKVLKSEEWIEYTLKSANASSIESASAKFLLSQTQRGFRLGKMIKFLAITAPEHGVGKEAALKFANMGLVKLGGKIGTATMRTVGVGLNIFAIALDVHTIVEAWTKQPELVSQIDLFKSYMENQLQELQGLRKEF